MKQFFVGMLVTIVLGAALFGLYQATQAEGTAAPAAESAPASELAAASAGLTAPEAIAAAEVPALPEPAVAVAAPLTTNTTVTGNAYGQQAGGRFGQTTNTTPGTPQVQAQTHMTTTLVQSGTVQAVELTGLSLITSGGEPLWVQLGQSRFWQSQGVTFNVGDQVTVTGFEENGQFQAISVNNDSTGLLLTLRDASGRPLWAGGNGNAGNTNGGGRGNGYRGGQG